MKNPRWFCSKCRQPFTRRWNANRHCHNKHFGAIDYIISFADYIINPTGHSIPLNNIYQNKDSNPLNVRKHALFDKPISTYNFPNNSITDSFDDLIEQESLPYKILDPIAPQYEEMQRILDSVPEPSKRLLLGNALSSAINSNNPVQTMNKRLRELRRGKTNLMMVNEEATFYNIDKTTVKELLKLKYKMQKQYH